MSELYIYPSFDDETFLNFLVRQKEGAQGKEEARDRRKGGPTGTPTPGADAPTGPTRSGVSNTRNRRKQGRRYWVPLRRRSREGKGSILSSHDRNGGSFSYRRMNEVCERVVL